LALGDFLWIVAQHIQFGADCFGARQVGIRVPFLGNQLAAHFRSSQPRIQATTAKLRVGLALAIDDRRDISQEIGQMSFGALSPTQDIGIQTDQTAIEFAQAFANGHAAPAQFACRTLLSTVSQFCDRAGHKQSARTALE
jgi:hypothetical protein